MKKRAALLAPLLLLAGCDDAPTAAPRGAALLFELTGKGTNTYYCRGGIDKKWDLQERTEETLLDRGGAQVGVAISTPYSTQWKAGDGSAILGEMAARSVVFHGDDLPDLLFTVATHSGTGRFSPVSSVRREHNSGGTPPARDCSPPGAEVKRPYSVTYLFYGAGTQ